MMVPRAFRRIDGLQLVALGQVHGVLMRGGLGKPYARRWDSVICWHLLSVSQ